MVIALRLVDHNAKLAFVDSLSAYGWTVDLSASTHVHTDKQWIPLFLARKVEGHKVHTVPLTDFLKWDAEQFDLNPIHERTESAYEGGKAVLA